MPGTEESQTLTDIVLLHKHTPVVKEWLSVKKLTAAILAGGMRVIRPVFTDYAQVTGLENLFDDDNHKLNNVDCLI